MLYKKDAIRIEIRDKTKSRSPYKVWYFKCSECDNEIRAQSYDLKTHSGKCGRCTQLGKPYMFIYNEIKNYRDKKVSFELTYEDLLKIIINEPVCHYCENLLIYHKHSRFYGKINSRAHQLDRKDNNKGYTVDNIVPCCWGCNKLKSDKFTYEEFLLFSPTLKLIMTNRYNKENGIEMESNLKLVT